MNRGNKSLLSFLKTGVPLFSLVFGGAYLLHFFQQVRYDFRKVRTEQDNFDNLKNEFKKAGVKFDENVTVEKLYQEVAELDTENWENIRGPRVYEDNTEYEKIKARQKEENQRRREARKRALQQGQQHASPVEESPPEPTAPSSSNNDAAHAPLNRAAASANPDLDVVAGPACDTVTDPITGHVQAERGAQNRVNLAVNEVPSHNTDPTDIPLEPQSQDPTEPEVNAVLLEQVVELGFDQCIAALAIQRTAGAGVEEAVNWIIDHSNESDLESEATNDETAEDESAMGARGSAPIAQAVAGSSQGTGITDAMAQIIRSLRPPRSHKMVFVANTGLKMGTGKLAAQVGHATLGVYRQASKTPEGQAALNAWRLHGEMKIVVKGQSTEHLIDLFKQAKDTGLHAYLVQDAGYTQIPPGSRTVLGVFGPVEDVDGVTGSLKLL
ncbi:Protein C24G6.8 [Aphelenchoides avenae]|nr:Protein C24G6.8 [Aphelenchus avenae]